MKLELGVAISVWAYYFTQPKWLAPTLLIIFAILILKYTPTLDGRTRIFIMTILAWNVIDVLARATECGAKNNELTYRRHNADPEADAPSLAPGVGSVAPEISQERGKTASPEPRLGSSDVGSEAVAESL